jgi:hypothetical protein
MQARDRWRWRCAEGAENPTLAGGGRFLKTLLCLHDEGGLVVVKVYQKRADTPPLEPYKQQLAQLRCESQVSLSNEVGMGGCTAIWQGK